MSGNTVQIATRGMGPNVNKEVSVEELSDYIYSGWQVVGEHSDYTVEELSEAHTEELVEEEEPTSEEEVAEEMARAWRARGREEMAEAELKEAGVESEEELNQYGEAMAPKDWKSEAIEQTRQLHEQKMQEKKEEAIQKMMDNYSWLHEPRHEKQLQELSGREWLALQEDLEEGAKPEEELKEELSAMLEDEEESQSKDFDTPVSPSIAEAAADAFSRRAENSSGKEYFAEMAEELEAEAENVEVVHKSDSTLVLEGADTHTVETSDPTLMNQIRSVDSTSENIEIIEEKSDSLKAVVMDYDGLETELLG